MIRFVAFLIVLTGVAYGAVSMKVAERITQSVASCSGERECETALEAAKSKAESKARAKGPQICSDLARKMGMASAKFRYADIDMTYSRFDRGARQYTFHVNIHCKLYRN